ncbi:hypothetical protein RUM43_002040 [Polyplax serrata]|uniref:Uncharacterized protein n=1 Tax=Polyplax serrata TaxID=468196 RepID=A0AAN8PC10_POLSC
MSFQQETRVAPWTASASLYHPQRRAIIHLKNQKKKIKEKKGHRKTEKPPLLDFSSLKIRAVQVLLLSSGTAAFGIYTPVFYLALQGYKEGLEHNTLVLLETFLGFATALGCIGFGLIVLRPSENCLVSRQYLCQAAMIGISISLLALGTVQGYHGYALFVWIYGICLGGFSYSLKMFTMERVRARHFTRAWGFVQGAEAIPVLLGVPITGYINQSHPKAGYYLSFFSAIIGAVLLYFVGVPPKEDEIPQLPLATLTNNNPRASICICPPISPRHLHMRSQLPKSVSFATTLDIPEPPLLGYISDERLPQYLMQYEYLRPGGFPGRRALRTCKSVPEGLARYDYYYRSPKSVQACEAANP